MIYEYTACPFCKEMKDGFFEINGKNYGNSVLSETDNFIVRPTLGTITEGYLLIISKKHLIGMGEVPDHLMDELEEVCQRVRLVLTNVYEAPVFFEHGPVCQSSISKFGKGVCCIDHAHIHAVPAKADLLPALSRKFLTKEIDSLRALQEQFHKQIPYFFYEDNYGKRYLFEISNDVPSQYMRRLIAEQIGKPDKWNWREHFEMDTFLKTLQTLKGKF